MLAAAKTTPDQNEAGSRDIALRDLLALREQTEQTEHDDLYVVYSVARRTVREGLLLLP